jgi:arylsulfatase A-like enzyme
MEPRNVPHPRLCLWIVLCLVLPIGIVSLAGATPTSPNIVLIVADDLGYADVGFHGSVQVRTPHLDRLAREGIVFTEGYVTAPVCSPSRAGFLTGRLQVRFGYDNNLVGVAPAFDPEYAGLPTTERTVADRLRPLGYVSGLIGKWHLGARPQFHPLRRGFNEFWGFLGGSHSYFPAEDSDRELDAPIESSYGPSPRITYLTDDIGREAVDFIRRHADRPFFLYASFNAPHTPMEALEEDLALYSWIADTRRRTYCAMVHRLDANVGRILQALDDAALGQRTLVAFISDNGGPVNANGSLNGPLNGQKGILLEGGIRVPFVLRWTGTLPAGGTFSSPVSTLDFTPTFVAAAGGAVTADDDLDGVNLLPYLTGEVEGPPHGEMRWRFTISAALREGDWKLVRLPDRLPMLFHLPSDLSEQNDVALDHLDRTEAMLERLGRWDVTLPHPLFLEGAVWKERQLELYDRSYPLEQPPGPPPSGGGR